MEYESIERKFIICQGIQGSGKSTWAKNWAMEEPNKRVRINRDDLRNMFGKYWVPEREGLVNEVEDHALEMAMKMGCDIVSDNMNLNQKTIEHIKHKVNLFNKIEEQNFEAQLFNTPYGPMPSRRPIHYTIEYKMFNTPLEVCIERDSHRESPIGAKVITETYNRYKDIICGKKE